MLTSFCGCNSYKKNLHILKFFFSNSEHLYEFCEMVYLELNCQPNMFTDLQFSGSVDQGREDCSIRALRERLRTHKVFTKDQCFYLNYHKFSIKSYVLEVY